MVYLRNLLLKLKDNGRGAAGREKVFEGLCVAAEARDRHISQRFNLVFPASNGDR